MIEKIKKSLLFKNKIQKKRIKELEKEVEKLNIKIKELKDINFEISSNNEYLIEQRKKYVKINRNLKKQLEGGKINER